MDTLTRTAEAQARLDTASAAHTEAAHALHTADDEWDHNDHTTWETFAEARRHHAETNEALARAHNAYDRAALLDRLDATAGE